MPLFNKVNKAELKTRLFQMDEKRTTLSFYKYHSISDSHRFRDDLYQLLSPMQVYGRIYVANEGINAQISVPTSKMGKLRIALEHYPFLKNLRFNVAIEDDGKSFYVLKIKVRDKIVADGIGEALDVSKGGKHIDASTYNDMVLKSDTIVVDMRNHYESEVGHFTDAICPDVDTFRDSLPVVEKILEKNKKKHVIMYCTGGIRCEKATAYFRNRGYDNLYQLDGGIIEYSRQVKNQKLENHFVGKNFVFDERLGERISYDVIAKCHQCGAPCDKHVNCANEACHLLFIQCQECRNTFQGCCSEKCKNFLELPAADQLIRRKTMTFNGSKFGKGRYKAHNNDDSLDLS
ncbi:MAG: rhodanese-related sulfurtransferase [Saprospiraceae bacterium]|nr:rhodanese-related sulfurtransferase [Saprospiraceae bacterium]